MEFKAFAAVHGLIIKSLEVGRWVRVPTIDHPRSRNGAYFFDGDYGHVQNWAEMAACESWRDDKPMTPRDTEALRLRMEASRKQHAIERAKDAANAASKAKAIIQQSRIEQHAYLDAKSFKDAVGLVYYPDEDTNLMVIPMAINCDVVGCQLIDRNGIKKFLKGQRTNGATFTFGSTGIDVWCEGYATARSIHACLSAIKVPAKVHSCFSAGNMQRMAKTGVVIADNDASQTGEKAAQATGLPYWMPPEVGFDFNDYHQSRGTFAAGMELRKFLQQARNDARPEPGGQETRAARA
jgi:putative DNA primase/helicase